MQNYKKARAATQKKTSVQNEKCKEERVCSAEKENRWCKRGKKSKERERKRMAADEGKEKAVCKINTEKKRKIDQNLHKERTGKHHIE